MILNERILKVVLTLAEQLHFGHAASTLHVSQSALSGTIKNLEHDLGVSLFIRTSRHVELTEAGRVLVAEARRLVAEGERVVSLVRECSPNIVGPLRIGYLASVDLRWLCSLICRARSDTLLVSGVQFFSTEAVHIYDDLIKGALHAVFCAGRMGRTDLQCVTLFREPFRVVLSSGHPLAQTPSLGFDQLKEEPAVWLSRESNPPLYDSFMALCSSQGYSPKMVQEVKTFYECLEFARGGLGITFLPAHMQVNDNDSSVFLRLPKGTLHSEYTLAWRRHAGSENMTSFLKFVQNHVSEKIRRCPPAGL
jgi:DNA-binding transcriptional LysR family regulator